MMNIKAFYDNVTATVSYVVSDPLTNKCAVIDPVLDFDPQSGTTSTKNADLIVDFILSNSLSLEWLLETHIHADHLTASAYIKEKLGGKIAIGSEIIAVLNQWLPLLNTGVDTPFDGSQFDLLATDGELFNIGSLQVKVMHTPGHTPACVSYLIEDAVFVGDSLFMPRLGTARADFPGGDAATLYKSIKKILALPLTTRVFTGHDYPPQGQDPCWQSTVLDQKQSNILINDSITMEQFIEARKNRDHTLPTPRLLFPAIQINLRAGLLGRKEANGLQYIKIPINASL